MVKIINYKTATSNDGNQFILLKVSGGLQLVQSMTTGKIYFKGKTAYVASNLDEASAQAVIGSEMPGVINRVACEPYDYIVESTGESITIDYRYEYQLEEQTINASASVAEKGEKLEFA
jgi:hypothetical protein